MFNKSQITLAFLFGVILSLLISFGLPAKAEVQTQQVVKIVKVPVELTPKDRRQIQCLAENTYFEAGNQTVKGKIAVNNVVMNRVNDPKERFGNTPCSVVSQKYRGVCQFSWKCEGRKKIRDQELFEQSKKIAEQVYLGNYGDVTGGAKFYHANYVSPPWGKRMSRLTKIGAHIFYDG